MSKGFLKATIIIISIFALSEAILIKGYGFINDRLQNALAKCINLKGE